MVFGVKWLLTTTVERIKAHVVGEKDPSNATHASAVSQSLTMSRYRISVPIAKTEAIRAVGSAVLKNDDSRLYSSRHSSTTPTDPPRHVVIGIVQI